MRLEQNVILVPVLAQVVLTLTVAVLMYQARVRSIRERGQRLRDIALATAADWNDDARKAANSYASQFEMPVLFYAASAFALATRTVDVALMLLALGFVTSRIVHAYIHLGSNRVRPRFMAFLAGFVLVAGMWALIGWRALSAGLL